MLQNSKAKQYYYALKSYADFRTQILENQFRGLLLKINDNEIWAKLIGSFNAYNLTAIYGVSELLGLKSTEALRLMSTLDNVNGRFEYFVSDTNITTIIDYAHTEDAFKNLLINVNSFIGNSIRDPGPRKNAQYTFIPVVGTPQVAHEPWSLVIDLIAKRGIFDV